MTISGNFENLISLIFKSENMDNKLLAREIKEHLNKHLENKAIDVIIFGSQIKGKASDDSDYDVLVVLKNDYNRKVKRMINDLCYDIDLKYDIFLDTQIISENELKFGLRGKHPVFTVAINEGYHA